MYLKQQATFFPERLHIELLETSNHTSISTKKRICNESELIRKKFKLTGRKMSKHASVT
jgi:hypothetical protein